VISNFGTAIPGPSVSQHYGTLRHRLSGWPMVDNSRYCLNGQRNEQPLKIKFSLRRFNISANTLNGHLTPVSKKEFAIRFRHYRSAPAAVLLARVLLRWVAPKTLSTATGPIYTFRHSSDSNTERWGELTKCVNVVSHLQLF
jgi:hypothetical protein